VTGHKLKGGNAMTPEQVKLIQDSFNQVRPAAEKVAEIFYGRLFEVAPGVRALFSDDVKPQGRKLMTMLATVVDGLDKLDDLVPAVQDLGARHVGYKAEPAHYDVVGEVLLWTLGQGLGDDFTADVEAAWTEAYTILASVMKDAAAQQTAAA
jgi:hemoglobin-like flavoprotein